jgi:hypothetical protein
MSDWVVSVTFDVDPGMAVMDAWESAIEARGFEGLVARVPAAGQSTMTVHVSTEGVLEATRIGHDVASSIVGAAAVGVETITEGELERRAGS